MASATFPVAEFVYVLEPGNRLRGHVPWPALLRNPDRTPMAQLVQPIAASVPPSLDAEDAASLAIEHGLSELPVLEPDGRFRGVVPAVTLLEILRAEHIEDLNRLAGIGATSEIARQALESPPIQRVRARLPWLLAGLAGSLLSTGIVAGYEQSLQSHIALAFFVPGLVYLADAIGTQTEAIAVRGISLSSLPWRSLLVGELTVGVFLGGLLALLSGVLVVLFFGDLRLAGTVGLAIVTAGAAATAIGLALPQLLTRLGGDPAMGSGPLATILQDVLTLWIYFRIGSWLVL